jgi:serine/threonine protein kinase
MQMNRFYPSSSFQRRLPDLGSPETKSVLSHDRSLLIIGPINFSRLSPSLLLKEDILFIGLYQSFSADHQPLHTIVLATPHLCLTLGAFFDMKVGIASDIWALACPIFEIRAGLPLFDNFFGSNTLIHKQIVETLDKFPEPEPWWSAWAERRFWFDGTRVPMNKGFFKSCEDDISNVNVGTMIKKGNRS